MVKLLTEQKKLEVDTFSTIHVYKTNIPLNNDEYLNMQSWKKPNQTICSIVRIVGSFLLGYFFGSYFFLGHFCWVIFFVGFSYSLGFPNLFMFSLFLGLSLLKSFSIDSVFQFFFFFGGIFTFFWFLLGSWIIRVLSCGVAQIVGFLNEMNIRRFLKMYHSPHSINHRITRD